MSTPTTKFVTTLLIVVLILSIVGIALIATLPRTPVTVTMPITVPSVSLVTISREVTVTAPAAIWKIEVANDLILFCLELTFKP